MNFTFITCLFRRYSSLISVAFLLSACNSFNYGTGSLEDVNSDSLLSESPSKIGVIQSNPISKSLPYAVPVLLSDDRSALKVNQSVVISGEQSYDPAGGAIQYYWKVETEPDGSSINLKNQNSTTQRFTPTVPGLYKLNLVVTDENGLRSGSSKIKFWIEEKHAWDISNTKFAKTNLIDQIHTKADSKPIATIQYPPLLRVNQTFVISGGESYDPAGGTIQYFWNVETEPGGSSINFEDPNCATQRFTPIVPGYYVFKLVVANESGVKSDPVKVKKWITVVEGDPLSVEKWIRVTSKLQEPVYEFDFGSLYDVKGILLLIIIVGSFIF